MIRSRVVPGLCVLVSAAVSAFGFPSNGNLYTPPASQPFIENSGESVVTVNDSSGSIATAQTALNNAHAGNPAAVVVLNLSGTYTVTTTPLVLSSHTCLVLQAHAVIQAGSGATASALIQVSGQTNVSIAGGTLLGNGASLNAIQVATSNRVEIDAVTVQNCHADGISLAGNGNSSYDNELTVTRCSVSGCTGNGITVASGTQCLVIDNTCSNNSGSGISISTARSAVANNTCSGNGTGITASGSYVKVSDNTATANGTGIALASGGSNNLAASNNVTNNTSVGISDAGTSDVVFQNSLSGNAAAFSGTGTSGKLFAWGSAIGSPGTDAYFYPPLIDNPHTATTIVNGLGRTDLTIGSDTLDDVQTQYNNAVSAHPSNVIVLHLTGTYTIGANALNLGSNTVVLLSGTIQEDASTTAGNVITITSGASNVAISGGTIDGGGHTAVNGINLSAGNGVWVHATTVQNFGVPSTRSGNSSGLIKFSSMKGPAFVSSSTTNESGTRGIWTEGSGPYVLTDNTCTNNNMDGIDCDYTTRDALVKFNNSSQNTRHGVFIEQGATYNTVYGNTFVSPSSEALSLYNNGEPSSLPVAYNTSFCNVMQQSGKGEGNGSGGTGSDGTTPLTSHNFFFNDTVINNGSGIVSNPTGTQNFYSQTTLSGNTTPITTSGSEAFFNPSTPPVVVADPTFSPGSGTYASAQTVTLTSATSGASIRYTTDGSTPSETAGTLYAGPISIAANTTLRAIAYATGMSDSNVTSATYAVQAAAPTFSPAGGSYTGSQSVAISSATSGVTIRYTTDGSTPSETAGTLYAGPVTVGSSETLKAIAYSSSYADSNVSSASYTITLPVAAAPTFSPAAGTYSAAQSVTISTTTSGASIRYTTDGSTPSETAGTLYSGPVTVSSSETLKAIAYESGYTDSAVSSASYTISLPQAAAPTFSPVGGTYSTAQSVTISTTTSGASIRYTTDGSTPSETAGTVYAGPVSIAATTTLKAIAYESGFTDSAVSTATYTINTGTTLTSANGFYNQALPAAQTGTFTATWDASVSVSPSNSLVGFSQGAASAYSAIAVDIRFNPSGNIDALSGSTYVANSTISYAANTTYHFRAVVNVAAHTYSAYVTPPGGSELTIGTNLGFRTGTTTDTQIDTLVAVVNATPGGSMTLSNFATTTYTITASAGTGGTISPSGSVAVSQGAGQTFTIAASAGYQISGVTVDGTSVGAVSTYTFSNVQANHTISASFAALPTYTITASAGTGGTISPTGTVTVNQGANQTFTIAANSGYSISSVTVDGASVGAVSTYTFSNVQANHTISAAFSANSGALPAGWTDVDVGVPAMAGSASYSSGTFTVTGGGTDIWGTADQFNYAYESTSGDMTVTAKVATQANTNAWTKSGVMFRGSTAANDMFVDVFVTPSNGIAMQYRTAVGGTCTSVAGTAGVVAPYWVRIVRSGTTFTGYSSADGTTWTQVGSATLSMATTATAGLEVCAHTATALNTSTFQNVTIAANATDTNIAPSGTAYGWFGMTSSTATTNQTAQPGLNDNNLTNNVDLDSAGDAVNAWEGVGVIWSSAKTISSADFINGDITTGGDGYLTAGLKLQFTTNGTTWTDSGWTISPTYPYSSAAGGQKYTASGTAVSGVVGARFVGQVRTVDTSYHWIVKEVQLIGH